MKRFHFVAFVSLAWFASPGAAAQATEAPSFEVASVRENRSGERLMLFQPRHGGRFAATNCSLNLLISYAYDVMQSHIEGAPAWVSSDRYDVAAKAQSDPPVEGVRAMLRRLLEERFQLRAHWRCGNAPCMTWSSASQAR